MIYINITSFVLISELEKDYSMIETHRLKNVIFLQKISSVVLSRKIIPKVYFESILEVCLKYTATIKIVKEEVYFKSMLFRQKKCL